MKHIALFATFRYAVLLGAALVTVGVGSAAPPPATGGEIRGTVAAAPPKYLPETVVYLVGVPGGRSHETFKMDQRGMEFVPHLLAISEGDTVEFLNHDSVEHNVFSPDGTGYDLGTFPPGKTRSHTFDESGVYTQLCSLHPEMLAYVFVGRNPYEAVVGADGSYLIDDVPPGTWKIEVWNPELKATGQSVTVTAGGTSRVDFSLAR
jgi:plastocyanin